MKKKPSHMRRVKADPVTTKTPRSRDRSAAHPPGPTTTERKARRGSVKKVSAIPARAPDAPANLDAWKLKIVVQEDEELHAHRVTVWLAPAGDSGVHLCIGSGPTRTVATIDAEVELRGALELLGKGADRPACEKCGFISKPEER